MSWFEKALRAASVSDCDPCLNRIAFVGVFVVVWIAAFVLAVAVISGPPVLDEGAAEQIEASP